MKLLHIDASILGEHSVSRQVSAAVVARLRATDPAIEVTRRDLAAVPLGHLTGAHLAAAQGAAPDPSLQADVEAGNSALAEFLAADIVVLGAPMYNFGVPTQLKAWIDRILIAGKTFRYTEKGVEGLAGSKRIIVAMARGGFYPANSPMAGAEHVETYLRTIFGFIGLPDIEIIAADGIATGSDQREKALTGALQAAHDVQSLKAA